MSQDEINILLTDITSIAIYAILFSIIFITGYINRASSIYNNAIKHNKEKLSVLAWYPFINIIAIAKLANRSYIPALISSVSELIFTIYAVICCIIEKQVLSWAIIIFIIIYLINSIFYYFIIKTYMDTYHPDKSNAYILFSSIIPLFKYLIFIEF